MLLLVLWTHGLVQYIICLLLHTYILDILLSQIHDLDIAYIVFLQAYDLVLL